MKVIWYVYERDYIFMHASETPSSRTLFLQLKPIYLYMNYYYLMGVTFGGFKNLRKNQPIAFKIKLNKNILLIVLASGPSQRILGKRTDGRSTKWSMVPFPRENISY